MADEAQRRMGEGAAAPGAVGSGAPPRDPTVAARIDKAAALVARFPDRAPPRFSWARALHDAGDYAAASAQYREAARLQPDLMMAQLHLAECALALGDAATAREAASAARDLARRQGHSGPLAEADGLLEAIEELEEGDA